MSLPRSSTSLAEGVLHPHSIIALGKDLDELETFVNSSISTINDSINSISSSTDDLEQEIDDISTVSRELILTNNDFILPLTNAPGLIQFLLTFLLSFLDQLLSINENTISFNIITPNNWVNGSNLTPIIYWIGEDGSAGNVYWKLSYTWANVDDSFPSVENDYLISSNDTDNKINTGSFSTINGTGREAGSVLLCTLTRNSSNSNDTYSGNSANLICLKFISNFSNA